MANDGGLIPYQNGCQRRAHHREWADLPSAYPLMRQARRFDQRIFPKCESLIARRVGRADSFGQCADGEIACNLAAFVAPEPIGYGVEPQLRRDAIGILVVRAAADMSCHAMVKSGRRASLSKRIH